MKNLYLSHSATIKDIIIETEDGNIKTFILELDDPEIRDNWKHIPGQFAMMSIAGMGEIPIGIASSPTEKDILSFTVSKIGVVTTELHNMKTGDKIGIRGPIGNGYPLKNQLKGKNILIIGGGYGFTTLRATIIYLIENRKDYNEINVIYGARNPGLLLYKKELEEWSKRNDINCHITVDREVPGWTGLVGFVPQILEKVAPESENSFALICGPPAMIKFSMPVLEKLTWHDNQILFSMENRMKCAAGVCGHCNIGPFYVCKDGPVITREKLKQLPTEY